MRINFFVLFSLACLFAGAQVESRLLNSLPDQARDDAVGFSIEGVGYIQGGRQADFALSDQLWAYDPAADQWEGRPPLPGIARQYSSSFVLDGKGYVFCGLADPGQFLDELWRYDPELDLWTQLNDFPGGKRFAPVSFTLDGTAYAGLGKGENIYYHDLWRYDEISDSWIWTTDLPLGLYSAISLNIKEKVLIGLGVDESEGYNSQAWLFDGNDIEETTECFEGIGFADAMKVESMAIIVGGRTEDVEAKNSLVEIQNEHAILGSDHLSWRANDGIAGGAKRNGTGFQIQNKGYYFGGKDASGVKSNQLVEFSLEPLEQELKIHPNPTKTSLWVQSSESFSTIEIFDLSGARVFEEKLGSASQRALLGIEGLAVGMYLLKLDTGAASRILIHE